MTPVEPAVEVKACRLCKADQPLASFTKRPKRAGYTPVCGTCFRARDAEQQKRYRDRHPERGPKYQREHPEVFRKSSAKWRANNRDKVKEQWQRSNMLKYGLTRADYDRMLDAQGGVCAICETDKPSPNGKRLFFAIDHDHATGEVRGLLCLNCNNGLGRFGDDVRVLGRAIAYLTKGDS